MLVPLVSPHYSGAAYFPNYSLSRDDKSTSTQSVEKKDFSKHFSIDQAIQDKVPGLYIHRKSGMPGEGAYLNLRGIHSVVADNTPLIVINGIPFWAIRNFRPPSGPIPEILCLATAPTISAVSPC